MYLGACGVVEIKRLSPNRIPELIRIYRGLDHKYYNPFELSNYNFKKHLLLFSSCLFGFPYLPYIAVIDGRIAGYICLRVMPDFRFNINVFVNPEFRRRGVCTQMEDFIFAEGGRRNLQILAVIELWNKAIMRVYLKYHPTWRIALSSDPRMKFQLELMFPHKPTVNRHPLWALPFKSGFLMWIVGCLQMG